jgi:hypothetical protein
VKQEKRATKQQDEQQSKPKKNMDSSEPPKYAGTLLQNQSQIRSSPRNVSICV